MESEHVETIQNGKKGKASVIKSIDSKVLESFKSLTSEDKNIRLNGGVNIVQYVAQCGTEEFNYILERLIRGCGASTVSSRIGFFSTLVGCLRTNNEVDVCELFEDLKKLLHISKRQTPKENSDVAIGIILFCGALFKSGIISHQSSKKDISSWIENLLTAASQKAVHESLAFSFLHQLILKMPIKQFKNNLWPFISEKVGVQWPKQTVNTINIILLIMDQYPEIIDDQFINSAFRTEQLWTPLAYKHLGRIFLSTTDGMIVSHPVVPAFAKFLASQSSKDIQTFWASEVNESVAASTKIKEAITVMLLTSIVENSEHFSIIPQLLTERFIKMLSASIKKLKQHIKDDIRHKIYATLFTAITTKFEQESNEKIKVQILEHIIFRPGNLQLEKYLTFNCIRPMVQHLNSESVKIIYGHYKNIFLALPLEGKKVIDNNWLNIEKQFAAQMMRSLLGHHTATLNDIEWRSKELSLLFSFAIFYTTADGKPIVPSDTTTAAVPKDLAIHLRNTFFTSLQPKWSKLDDELACLKHIVVHINEVIKVAKAKNYLRAPLSDEALDSWNIVVSNVTKKGNKNVNRLDTVFHILLMHMGLQIFKEADMAVAAIDDVVKCMDRAKKSNKPKQRGQILDGEEEPEWIEVVVDLFLHLLSKNASFLRNTVDTLFPNFCNEITPNAMDQILAMLDMKDGNNPLDTIDDDQIENDDDSKDESESEESENESDNDENESEEEIESVSGGSEDEKKSESEEEDSDVELDDEMEDIDGEITQTERIRGAVQMALGTESDQESMDLDEMTEEEGARLDAVLANAFKSIKTQKSNSKKKTKEERITSTTVMHFRIRVLDLIDIYLRQKPSMQIALNIMVTLFDMIEHCASKDLDPLAKSVQKVLRKLTQIKQFKNHDDIICEDVTEGEEPHDRETIETNNLISLCQMLLETKVKAIVQDDFHQLMSKAILFLIHCCMQLDINAQKNMAAILNKYTIKFITSRNPEMTINILQSLLSLRWKLNYTLINTIATTGLKKDVRPFRRAQCLELLSVFYKNHALIKQEFELKEIKKIEKSIETYINEIKSNNTLSSKEINAVSNLSTQIHRCHLKIAEIKTGLLDDIVATVQQIKKINSGNRKRKLEEE